jgi:hypothetical protein
MSMPVPIIHRLAPPTGRGQTPLHHLQQVLILQRRLYALFIVQLLIDRVLGLMCALFDADVDAESGWERSHQADS